MQPDGTSADFGGDVDQAIGRWSSATLLVALPEATEGSNGRDQECDPETALLVLPVAFLPRLVLETHRLATDQNASTMATWAHYHDIHLSLPDGLLGAAQAAAAVTVNGSSSASAFLRLWGLLGQVTASAEVSLHQWDGQAGEQLPQDQQQEAGTAPDEAAAVPVLEPAQTIVDLASPSDTQLVPPGSTSVSVSEPPAVMIIELASSPAPPSTTAPDIDAVGVHSGASLDNSTASDDAGVPPFSSSLSSSSSSSSAAAAVEEPTSEIESDADANPAVEALHWLLSRWWSDFSLHLHPTTFDTASTGASYSRSHRPQWGDPRPLLSLLQSSIAALNAALLPVMTSAEQRVGASPPAQCVLAGAAMAAGALALQAWMASTIGGGSTAGAADAAPLSAPTSAISAAAGAGSRRRRHRSSTSHRQQPRLQTQRDLEVSPSEWGGSEAEGAMVMTSAAAVSADSTCSSVGSRSDSYASGRGRSSSHRRSRSDFSTPSQTPVRIVYPRGESEYSCPPQHMQHTWGSASASASASASGSMLTATAMVMRHAQGAVTTPVGTQQRNQRQQPVPLMQRQSTAFGTGDTGCVTPVVRALSTAAGPAAGVGFTRPLTSPQVMPAHAPMTRTSAGSGGGASTALTRRLQANPAASSSTPTGGGGSFATIMAGSTLTMSSLQQLQQTTYAHPAPVAVPAAASSSSSSSVAYLAPPQLPQRTMVVAVAPIAPLQSPPLQAPSAASVLASHPQPRLSGTKTKRTAVAASPTIEREGRPIAAAVAPTFSAAAAPAPAASSLADVAALWAKRGRGLDGTPHATQLALVADGGGLVLGGGRGGGGGVGAGQPSPATAAARVVPAVGASPRYPTAAAAAAIGSAASARANDVRISSSCGNVSTHIVRTLDFGGRGSGGGGGDEDVVMTPAAAEGAAVSNSTIASSSLPAPALSFPELRFAAGFVRPTPLEWDGVMDEGEGEERAEQVKTALVTSAAAVAVPVRAPSRAAVAGLLRRQATASLAAAMGGHNGTGIASVTRRLPTTSAAANTATGAAAANRGVGGLTLAQAERAAAILAGDE